MDLPEYLHDALIQTTDVRYDAQEVHIGLEYYRTPESAHRTPAVLTFAGVKSISATASLERMKLHEFAGTVSDWEPRPGGTTLIFLAAGAIAIQAESLVFEEVSREGWVSSLQWSGTPNPG